jgi:uncharacterized protein
MQAYEFIDLGISFGKTLIISDLHIGYEESLRQKGMLIPLNHTATVLKSIDEMISQVQPKQLIIVGDIKHDFHTINKDEWKSTKKLLSYLKTKNIDIIIVKGNHDNLLKPVLDSLDIPLFDSFLTKGFFFCHGDKLIDIPKGSHTIIIGHEHPAITLREKNKTETYKCFLKSLYQDKDLLVLPSVNSIAYGKDMLTERPHSPFLIEPFRIFVTDKGMILDFGMIEDLRNRFNQR